MAAALSLFVHGLLYLLLFGLILPGPIAETPPRPRLESFEIEIISPTDRTVSIAGSSANQRPGEKQHADSGTARQKLQLGLSSKWGQVPSASTSSAASSFEKDIRNPWGAAGGDFGRVKDAMVLDRIYQKIDNALFYPGVFVRHKVEGTTNSRIVIEPQGGCDWAETKVQAGDKHLRAFTYFILHKACSGYYFKHLGIKEKMVVDLSFSFRIQGFPMPETAMSGAPHERFIVGNVMTFKRHGVHFATTWELGPFTGTFPLPVVYINFPWLGEIWEKHVEKRDPMRSYEKTNPG